MLIDKGLNDRWIRPDHVKRVGKSRYRIVLKETIGQSWSGEIVSYQLPAKAKGKALRVTLNGSDVASQISEGKLFIRVENLAPGREHVYEVRGDASTPAGATADVRLIESGSTFIFTNGLVSLRLPASAVPAGTGRQSPGPIVAIRRGSGPWIGKGHLETSEPVRSIRTRLLERGPLWTTVEVAYTLDKGRRYRVRLSLRPNDEACEVNEESDLPVRLWPSPRPYKEIGSLGGSFWAQPLGDIAKPCLRPCPSSNFIFDLGAGLAPDRMVTHSTSSWEIMDMPLHSPTLKTYTAMRPALSSIDGGWLGVYASSGDDLIGVAALDITHWKAPDDMVHPAHRTPGASAEVFLVDSRKGGSYLRFPIENVTRRWLFVATDAANCRPRRIPKGRPVRLDPNPNHPLWSLRRRRGDLPLNKVKDWVVDWPDTGIAHPRVLCRKADFPAIRRKIRTVPELRANYETYKPWRAADRFIVEGKRSGLATVEAQTHARELVEGILARGYMGPTYCIGLARPLRRYALACDILWDCFTPDEKREARRVCALGAYILSDGDWWQFTFRTNETTYLPNFNTDVFACAGIVGLFLADHPCSRLWTDFCVERFDIELKQNLRRDGGGEENVGGYLMSTWTQLYLPALWALRHCRVKDFSNDPNVLGGARFLTKIFCPPDPRAGGLRLGPPIGHHPHAKKAFPFLAWLAAFIRKTDPATSSELMWTWRRCGAPVGNLHDHSGPTANPFTRHYVFHDPGIPEIPPVLKSSNLPHVGAVLRTGNTSDKASYLFLKAGRVHSHHDDDEGSFHYFGRGVPLALDGLRIANGATKEEHNQVSFGRYGQPTGIVEKFTTTAEADYVRAVIAPRAFCCDSNYADGTHRSGWTREIVLIRADEPGGVEYVVLKDTCVGPDPCQWNLDVLSRRPIRQSAGHVWFPGHSEFNMGLDVFVLEPSSPRLKLDKGIVNPDLLTAARRRKLLPHFVSWPITEHWLIHIPAAAVTTFFAVLFPRPPGESPPAVVYLEREETVSVAHSEGRDLIFLRPNPLVGTNIGGVAFRGRAGVYRERNDRRSVRALDAVEARLVDYPSNDYRIL